MAINVIRNPVRTPEEMARFLGVSAKRLAAVRQIMSEEDIPSAKYCSSHLKGSRLKTTPKKSRKRA
jgi:hypothetical protein